MKTILMLCVAMLLSTQGMAQFSWASPTQLSASGVDSSSPRITIDPMGNITAIWIEGDAVKANTMPVGMGWGTPSTLAMTGSGSSNSRLGVDAHGNVTAIWVQSSVIYSAYLPLGGSWSSGTAISGSGSSTPQLDVDSYGNAIAVWVSGASPLNAIQSATALASMVTPTWSIPVTLSSVGADGPQIAISDNGTAIAVWHIVISGQDNIQSSTTPVTGSWTPTPKTVVAGALKNNYPKVAMDSEGNATVAWFRYSFNQTTNAYTNVDIPASLLPFGATVWTLLPTILSGEGQRNPSSFNLRLASDPNGNVVAAWCNSYDGSLFNVEANIRTPNGVWSGLVTLDVADPYAFSPDVAVTSSGNALLTYMFFDGTSTSIQTLEGSAPSIVPNFWSFPQTVSQGAKNGFPHCAIATSPTTLYGGVVYLQYDGSNQIVQTVTATETPIAPPTGLMRTPSSTNFGIFTDVQNTLSWVASTDPNVNSYVIYRNGIFFTQTDPTTLTAVDHNVTGSPTYTIATLTNNFEQSAPVPFP